MTPPLRILILSDGKPGHENQSYGLAEAIGRIRPVEISLIRLAGLKGFFSRIRHARDELAKLPAPRLLLGAGHAVHTSLLALSRKTGAPSVVLMKPSLPASFFDLCLVPEHDLEMRQPSRNVVPTKGALNRVPPPAVSQRQGGLILLGGPSGSHGWDGETVTSALEDIIAASSGQSWAATDSRRTPEGQLSAIAARIPRLQVFPHAETGRDWLPSRLSSAAEVWVTEESISMIYEALSSGAKVGLLPVPSLKKAGRVARGIARLADAGYVTPFSRWSAATGLSAAPAVLREADRCAAIVTEKLLSS
jgi:mitochondrial fission protein ELM1